MFMLCLVPIHGFLIPSCLPEPLQRQADDCDLDWRTTNPDAHNFRFNRFQPKGLQTLGNSQRVSTAPRGAALRSEPNFQKCSPKTPTGNEPATCWLRGAASVYWVKAPRRAPLPIAVILIRHEGVVNNQGEVPLGIFAFTHRSMREMRQRSGPRCWAFAIRGLHGSALG